MAEQQVFIDMKKEKTNLEILAEMTAKLNKVISDMDDLFETDTILITETNFDGYFTRVSKGWTNLFGYTNEEMRQNPWISFVHPDDVENTLNVFEGMKKGTAVNKFVNRYRCKDGTYRTLLWRAPAYDEYEKARKAGTLFCTIIDITME